MTVSTPDDTAQQSPEPPSDRQQRTRDRIAEVEAQVQDTTDALTAATSDSTSTADKLERARGALRRAEQDHDRALKRMEALASERQQLQGELDAQARRLELGSIVRKARG